MSSIRSSFDESVGDGGLHLDEALLDQVAEQDADDADRHRDQGRDLGDGTACRRPRGPAAHQRSGRLIDASALLAAQGRLHGQVDGRLRCDRR